MAARTDEPKDPPDDEVERETRTKNTKEKPDPDRLTRARHVLELATSLAALLLTLGSALAKLRVGRLPTLAPTGATKNYFAIVAAFQNGFFWQTLFSGLKPFSAS